MVTGLGRSGTTWMQHFLSQHPRIHIHGQSPNIRWNAFWDWCQTLARGAQWSEKANRHVGYEIAHYAGSDGSRCRETFKRMFREYMTGHGLEKPRWGLKWIDFCADWESVCQFVSLWPETRWVVCLRDPFLTISSTKNTFVPNLNLHGCATAWVSTCRFIERYDPGRLAAVQMDQLDQQTHQQRRAAMDRVFACVGEQPTRETEQFLRRWPIVHKVRPDEKRRFSLSDQTRQKLLEEVPELRSYMERMGYSPSGTVNDEC